MMKKYSTNYASAFLLFYLHINNCQVKEYLLQNHKSTLLYYRIIRKKNENN